MKKTYISLLIFLFGTIGISYAQSPIASFQVTDTSGCAPFTISFINNSSHGINYQWDFGNGNTSTLESPINTYTHPGVYDVTLIATSLDGQKDTLILPHFIHVLEPPFVDFSVSKTQICPNNDTLFFTNHSTGAVSYLWDFGSGSISTLANPSHIYSSPGHQNISLIGYNSHGCFSSASKLNLVEVLPIPITSILVDQDTMCGFDSSITFSASSTAKDLLWNFSDGSSDTGIVATHSFSSPGSYPISVIATDTNGCSSTDLYHTPITVLAVNEPTIVVSDTLGCPPLDIVVSNTTPNTTSVVWSINNQLSLNSVSQYSLSQPGSHDINIQVTDSNNCVATKRFDSLIVVKNVPNGIIEFNDSVGCTPFMVPFHISSSSTYYYNWDFGNGQNSSLINPVGLYEDAGQYTVSVSITDPLGCNNVISSSTLIEASNVSSGIEVLQTSGCAPFTAQFKDTIGTAASWNWNFGDGTTSSMADPDHEYTTSGSFPIEVIVSNIQGCIDTILLADSILVRAPHSPNIVPDTTILCNSITSNFNGLNIGQNYWKWDFGDGTVSNDASTTHMFSTPGTFSVSLTTQDVHGCEFTIPNYSTYIIGGNSIGFDYGSSCQANLFSFADTSQGGIEWTWDFGDGTVDTGRYPIHQYSDYGIFFVNMKVESADGCTNNVTKLVSTIDCYIINELSGGAGALTGPNLNYTVVQDSVLNIFSPFDSLYPQCAPYTVSFTNPSSFLTDILWDFGDGTTSTDFSPNHTYTEAGVYDLQVTMQTPDTSFTLSSPQFIWINDVHVDFEMEHDNMCGPGAAVRLRHDGNDNFSFLWSFGDGDTSTTSSPTHRYDEDGHYTAKLKSWDESGCVSLVTKPIEIGNSNPIFNYEKEVCIDETVSLTHNISNYRKYQWMFSDGNQKPSEDITQHSYNDPGNYYPYLLAVDSTNCADTFRLPEPIVVLGPVANFTIPENYVSACERLIITPDNISKEATSWKWDFGDGSTSPNEFPRYTYDLPGNYDVTLVALNKHCSDTLHVPNLITVHAPSKADFSYTKQSPCYPVTLDFVDHTSNVSSRIWDFGDNTYSSDDSVSHTFLLYDQPNITLTTVDSNGCTSSISKLGEKPFQSAFHIANRSGCVPVEVEFVNDSDSSLASHWIFGDGNESSEPSPIHSYRDSGSYYISLISTSLDGCIDTATLSNPLVIEELIADFTIDDTITSCAPAVANFTNLSSNADDWLWDFGDGSTSTIATPSHLYSNPGIYSISLIVSQSSGCTDTLIQSDLLKVSGPIAAFNVADTTGCDSMVVNFNNGSSEYQNSEWYFGDGNFSFENFPTHTYSDTGTFYPTLIVHDTSGCSTYIDGAPISIYPSPLPEISTSDTIGCAPLEANFDNTSAFGKSYFWHFGNGNSSVDTLGSTIYTDPGTFLAYLNVSNEFGCFAKSDTISIQVNPVPDFDFTTDTSLHCSESDFQFDFLSSDTTLLSYEWSLNDEIMSNEISPTISIDEYGSYEIELVVNNIFNCATTITKPDYINISDSVPPVSPEVYTASVLRTDEIQLLWDKSEAHDFESYVIFHKNEDALSYLVFDTIKNIETTTLSSDKWSPQLEANSFKIQTIDQCGNYEPLANLVEYKTMHLSTKNVDSGVHLSWNKYIGCEHDSFTIFRINEQREIFKIKIDTHLTSYVDTSFMCPGEQEYFISTGELCDRRYTSTSNLSKIRSVNENILIQNTEIVASTVVHNDFVYTEWRQPTYRSDQVIAYHLYRSTNEYNGFEKIADLPGSILQYSDYDVEVNEQNYFYKIELVNSCNFHNHIPNISSSIFLNGNVSGNQVILNWTPYRRWDSGVGKYRIEKRVDGGDWQFVKDLPGSSNVAISNIIDQE